MSNNGQSKLSTSDWQAGYLNENSLKVLALLKKASSGEPFLTNAQLEELRVNKKIKYTAESEDYITGVNLLVNKSLNGSRREKRFSLAVSDLITNKENLKISKEVLDETFRLHNLTGKHYRNKKLNYLCKQETASLFDTVFKKYRDALDLFEILEPYNVLLKTNSSSRTERVKVKHLCCGRVTNPTVNDFVKMIKRRVKSDVQLKCKECSLTTINSLLSDYKEVLDNSGVTKDDFLLDLLNVPLQQVNCIKLQLSCCNEPFETSGENLRSKLKRAVSSSANRITCNSCAIPQGRIEGAIIEALNLHRRFMSKSTGQTFVLDSQFSLPVLEGRFFDIYVKAPNGVETLIEIDGGFHYKRIGNKQSTLLRLENDRDKTAAALDSVDCFIRIEEELLSNKKTLPDDFLDVLLQVCQGELKGYFIYGRECPGAALNGFAYTQLKMDKE